MGTEMQVIMKSIDYTQGQLLKYGLGTADRAQTGLLPSGFLPRAPHDCQDYLHQIRSDQVTPANAVPVAQNACPSWASAYFSSLILGNHLKLQLHLNTHCS